MDPFCMSTDKSCMIEVLALVLGVVHVQNRFLGRMVLGKTVRTAELSAAERTMEWNIDFLIASLAFHSNKCAFYT